MAAHCGEVQTKSYMTSFRSNRFNCVFEADAAIIHHKDHLKGLLGSETPSHTNKLSSVHADCSDNNLLCLVCAIALLHFGLTGPFLALQSQTQVSFSMWKARNIVLKNWEKILDLYFPGVFFPQLQRDSVFTSATADCILPKCQVSSMV